MSPYLKEDNPVVQFVTGFCSQWMPGYEIARHPDGSLHIVLLHHAESSSGTVLVQTAHTDLPCLVSASVFSHETLAACQREDGPRVAWFDLEALKSIGLYLYLGSHRVTIATNRFYAENYSWLLEKYLEDHRGE